MDKLLDKEVHQLYKAPSLSSYLASGSAAPQAKMAPPAAVSGVMEAACMARDEAEDGIAAAGAVGGAMAVPTTSSPALSVEEGSGWQEPIMDDTMATPSHSLDYLDLQKSFSQLTAGSGGARPKTSENLLNKYAR